MTRMTTSARKAFVRWRPRRDSHNRPVAAHELQHEPYNPSIVGRISWPLAVPISYRTNFLFDCGISAELDRADFVPNVSSFGIASRLRQHVGA
jgi:hypothetical protein